MVSIYCKHNTPRLQYVVNHVFGSMLGLPYTITTHADEFATSSAARINYSGEDFEGALQITPSGFLEETGTRTSEPGVGEWDDEEIIFDVDGGDIPLDIFSAVFYLLSRIGEYSDWKRGFTGTDRYSTFHDLLPGLVPYPGRPLVDIWVHKFGQLLSSRFGINIQPKAFKIIPTLDIDQAFYFRYKGLKRIVGGMAKQLLKGNLRNALTRLLVTSRLKPDPNDIFEWMEQLHAEAGVTPKFFIHVGDRGPKDDPTPYTNKKFRRIVKRLAALYPVGVHPSYPSEKNAALMKKEKARLEDIIEKPVTISRQHYLMLQLPYTYRCLIEAGITEDYTMGFAEETGYRAGTAFPFLWYDLEREQTTGLTVYPFALMDVTLKNYMKLTPQQAKEEIGKLLEWPVKYGGNVHVLWHNESLSEFGEWKGWREVYKWMLTFGKNGN
ncbi:MAG TPA: polysaccharide deacetylase family protein [Bacteroidia bacterium]|nr:polysaccharide deacetylase family protein [Bacteroidia bacterium]